MFLKSWATRQGNDRRRRSLIPHTSSPDPTLEAQIRASKDLIPLAKQLSTLSSAESEASASQTQGSDDGEADGGEGEIRSLASAVLGLLEV